VICTTYGFILYCIVLYSIVCCNDIAGASCADGDLSMNSKCYRKFDRQLSWYNASNDCLSRGGSLAVFIDIGRPSDNSQLTKWLNASGTNMTYWIGLIRTWWENMDKGFLISVASFKIV